MTSSDLMGFDLQTLICVGLGLQRWLFHAGRSGQPDLVLVAIASRPFGYDQSVVSVLISLISDTGAMCLLRY